MSRLYEDFFLSQLKFIIGNFFLKYYHMHYLKAWLIRSAKFSKSTAFAYFSICTKVSKSKVSKNYDAKKSVANFSAPNELSYSLYEDLKVTSTTHIKKPLQFMKIKIFIPILY